MDDFDKKMDDFTERYEKSIERNVDQIVNATEKVSNGLNRLYIGCALIIGNLCFLAFCAWGAYAAYNSWNLTQNGETATGIVIELTESSDPETGCCVYSPVIEFQANGQTYTFESLNASDPPQYKVGQEVRVIYDPANPSKAQINKFSERWLMPIILIPAMIITSIIFTFAMIHAFRRNESIE